MMNQAVPKFKNNAVSYILKVAMFAAFYFSCIFATKEMYNLLPYTQYGQKVLEMIEQMNSTTFLYIAPLVSALVLFGLFHLIEKYCFANVSRTLSVFEKQIDEHYFYNTTAIAFVIYSIINGCEKWFFLYYPLSRNIAEPIISVLLMFVTMASIFLILAKKVTKEYAPFVFSSLLMPTCLLLIIA